MEAGSPGVEMKRALPIGQSAHRLGDRHEGIGTKVAVHQMQPCIVTNVDFHVCSSPPAVLQQHTSGDVSCSVGLDIKGGVPSVETHGIHVAGHERLLDRQSAERVRPTKHINTHGGRGAEIGMDGAKSTGGGGSAEGNLRSGDGGVGEVHVTQARGIDSYLHCVHRQL